MANTAELHKRSAASRLWLPKRQSRDSQGRRTRKRCQLSIRKRQLELARCLVAVHLWNRMKTYRFSRRLPPSTRGRDARKHVEKVAQSRPHSNNRQPSGKAHNMAKTAINQLNTPAPNASKAQANHIISCTRKLKKYITIWKLYWQSKEKQRDRRSTGQADSPSLALTCLRSTAMKDSHRLVSTAALKLLHKWVLDMREKTKQLKCSKVGESGELKSLKYY